MLALILMGVWAAGMNLLVGFFDKELAYRPDSDPLLVGIIIWPAAVLPIALYYLGRWIRSKV